MDDHRINAPTALVDLADPAWFTDPSKSSVWVRAYRVFRQRPNELQVITLPRARAILISGIVRYADHSQMRMLMHDETNWEMVGAPNPNVATPPGTYLLLMLPFVTDGQAPDEPDVRARLSEITAVAHAIAGKNAVFSVVFENEIAMNKLEVSAVSPSYLNPTSIDPPRLGRDNLGQFRRVMELVHDQSEHSAKLRLSLRWYEASTREEDHTDAFVKCWVALETLAMTTYSDLNALVGHLAHGYGISDAEARATFHVGQVFRVRGRIIHEGLLIPMPYWVLDYLWAVYVDILFDVLGEIVEGRARRVLDRFPGQIETFLVRSTG